MAVRKTAKKRIPKKGSSKRSTGKLNRYYAPDAIKGRLYQTPAFDYIVYAKDPDKLVSSPDDLYDCWMRGVPGVYEDLRTSKDLEPILVKKILLKHGDGVISERYSAIDKPTLDGYRRKKRFKIGGDNDDLYVYSGDGFTVMVNTNPQVARTVLPRDAEKLGTMIGEIRNDSLWQIIDEDKNRQKLNLMPTTMETTKKKTASVTNSRKKVASRKKPAVKNAKCKSCKNPARKLWGRRA